MAGHSVTGGAREVAIANQTERAVALRVADFGAAVEDLASMLGGIEGENPLLAESLRGVVRDAPDVDVRTWLHALLHLGRVAAPALRDALFAGQRRAARARADQLIRAAPTITGCARIAAVLALGTADTTTPGTPAEAAPLFFEALATSAFAHCLERLRDDLGVIEHWLAEDTQAVAPIHLEGASSWAWALAPRPTDGHSRTGMVPWTPTPNAHGGVPAVTHLPLSPATRAPVMRTPVARTPSIVGLPTLDDAEREPPTRWETTAGAAVARPADRRRRSAFGVAHRLLPEAVAARSDIRRLWLLSTAFSLLLLALALTVQILGPLLTADTRASDAGQGAGVASIQATQTVAVVPTTSLSDTTGTTAATPAPTTARPTTAATTAKPAPPSTGAAIVPLVGTLSLHCGVNTTLGLYNATTSVKTFTLAVPPGVRSNGLRGVVNPGKTLPILLWLAPRTQASRATATLTAAGRSSPIVLTIPSC